MINNINKLFEEPKTRQLSFLKNCTVEEKICAYRFSVKIISLSNFRFYKGNKEITQDMIILNRIWETLVKDWTTWLISNPDIIKKYIGYIFFGFYFPDPSPFDENYKYENIYKSSKYLINKVVNWKGIEHTGEFSENGLFVMQQKYKLADLCNPEDINNQEDIKNIISNIKSYSSPAYGWILKDSERYYQIQNCPSVHYESNKVPLELMLTDFIDYLDTIEYDSLIHHNYVLSICNFFEDYILSEKCHLVSKYKLTAEDLEAPYYGKYFGISYNYIPSEKTRQLCIQNKLYENVFKIMLANFKRYKDFNGAAILNSNKINKLNNFIKYIKLMCRV